MFSVNVAQHNAFPKARSVMEFLIALITAMKIQSTATAMVSHFLLQWDAICKISSIDPMVEVVVVLLVVVVVVIVVANENINQTIKVPYQSYERGRLYKRISDMPTCLAPSGLGPVLSCLTTL